MCSLAGETWTHLQWCAWGHWVFRVWHQTLSSGWPSWGGDQSPSCVKVAHYTTHSPSTTRGDLQTVLVVIWMFPWVVSSMSVRSRHTSTPSPTLSGVPGGIFPWGSSYRLLSAPFQELKLGLLTLPAVGAVSPSNPLSLQLSPHFWGVLSRIQDKYITLTLLRVYIICI